MKINIKNKLLKLNNKGQTLIEYLIIVVLIGLGSIVAVTKLRQKLNTKFNQVTTSINKISPSNSKKSYEDSSEASKTNDGGATSSIADWIKDQIIK